MKNLSIFLAIVVLIVGTIFGIYINYKVKYNVSKQENLEFEIYKNKEIYGTDLATAINKAIDYNTRNLVEKNDNGIYINNDKCSINIEIKMIDNDTIYQMENIYNGGIQNFIKYYNNIKFVCTDIRYHKSTNKIKYVLFEQITQ